ncbi:polymer-forming cytoskeletal protein [uncultured Massilia sp.]|uniref:polymer-forming cytoskeletal protein n=1 Tax=uncultured Massilia sp. TaxID=169973 RepID=UPI0025EA44AE|nr:polymer-forming cytoskeletal protein [uncultured Massilia sp.]
MPLRSLPGLPCHLMCCLMCFLMLAVAGPARAGVTYTFAGGTVDGCSLSGKTYTCPALPLPNWDDKVVISGGHTVQANGDVNFGYNQGLSMTGNSTLKVSGNLNIGGINPALLAINNANFIAGGQFAMGAQTQTIAANITAGTMQLGTGSTSKITGTIVATGAIAIASNVTIVGPITGTRVTTNSPVYLTGDVNASESFFLASGSTIKGNIVSPVVDTNSPVTINGNVTAATSFTFASGSTMNGNVKSDVVRMYASNAVINGNVTATTSLTMGSADVVKGDVDTGELTLEASNSQVTGNATVNHATLYWAARVTDTIICRNGSTPGKCDCVTNNSGYDVRNIKTSGNGPYCEGKAQPLHHFQITHPATAGVCTKAQVTVTACADANCTSTYAGAATVYLQPTKQRIDVSGGAATATAQLPPGAVTLGLTSSDSGGALSTTCKTGSAASNCSVQVSDASLELNVNGTNAFTAGGDASEVDLNIIARTYDGSKQACVPLFQGVQRNIAVSYDYANPATGTQKLRLARTDLARATERTLALSFDATGKAATKVSYPDAGQLKFSARATDAESKASGNVLAVAAPASLKVAFTGLAAPRKAGYPFGATVTAVNAAGAVTANFGKEAQPELARLLAPTLCQPSGGKLKYTGFDGSPKTVNAGSQDFADLAMNEVGTIDVGAALAGSNGYLGSGLRPTGTTNTAASGCSGASGPFVPAYLQVVTEDGWQRRTKAAGIPQYYANEPRIRLAVRAVNKDGNVTENYAGAYARDVALAAVTMARQVPATPLGSFQRSATCNAAGGSAGAGNLACASLFANGVANWTGAFALPGSAAAPGAPATFRARATEVPAAAGDPVAASATSTKDEDEPPLQVVAGRARLSSNYGYAGQPLLLNLTLEYWDGATWRRNFDDSLTQVPLTAYALTTADTPKTLEPTAIGLAYKPTDGNNSGVVALDKGGAVLRLTPPANGGRGAIDVALNLGTTGADNACAVSSHPASTGAALPFLRTLDTACKDINPVVHDPRARATFGIFTPESKRIIHVREVFR